MSPDAGKILELISASSVTNNHNNNEHFLTISHQASGITRYIIRWHPIHQRHADVRVATHVRQVAAALIGRYPGSLEHLHGVLSNIIIRRVLVCTLVNDPLRQSAANPNAYCIDDIQSVCTARGTAA